MFMTTIQVIWLLQYSRLAFSCPNGLATEFMIRRPPRYLCETFPCLILLHHQLKILYRCNTFNMTLIGIVCSHREDAEAPKAKLVKPNSLSSSRSGSSRSGASSTQSMVHSTAPRSQRPRPPAICALKENGQPPEFLQSSPEPPTTPKFRLPNPTVGLAVPTTGVLMPPQSKAFQTV